MATPPSKPVTDIKRHATEIIAQLKTDRRPVLITERGRSAAVLLDVDTYDSLRRRLALLEGIARGERAFAEGRTVSHTDAKKRLRRWVARRP
jgi:prevent-host-death family protein